MFWSKLGFKKKLIFPSAVEGSHPAFCLWGGRSCFADLIVWSSNTHLYTRGGLSLGVPMYNAGMSPAHQGSDKFIESRLSTKHATMTPKYCLFCAWTWLNRFVGPSGSWFSGDIPGLSSLLTVWRIRVVVHLSQKGSGMVCVWTFVATFNAWHLEPRGEKMKRL